MKPRTGFYSMITIWKSILHLEDKAVLHLWIYLFFWSSYSPRSKPQLWIQCLFLYLSSLRNAEVNSIYFPNRKRNSLNAFTSNGEKKRKKLFSHSSPQFTAPAFPLDGKGTNIQKSSYLLPHGPKHMTTLQLSLFPPLVPPPLFFSGLITGSHSSWTTTIGLYYQL